jgi:hypothetical protein
MPADSYRILPQQPNAYAKSVFIQEYGKATATGAALRRTTGVTLSFVELAQKCY